jgi:hypothetical protein
MEDITVDTIIERVIKETTVPKNRLIEEQNMQWLTKKNNHQNLFMAILVVGMTISPLPQFILASSLLIFKFVCNLQTTLPKR